MVASEIKEEKEKELDFPKLMIAKKSGVIVLFEKENHGTTVFRDIANDIGDYSNQWDMFQFVDFKGELTLKNKDNEQF